MPRIPVPVVAAAVGLACALVPVAPGPATAAASSCVPSPNAPAGMNPIPAFSGCEPPVGSGQKSVSSVADAVGTVTASTPIGARIPFARTNGDILAITKVRGATRPLVAFGGNFTAVITPDGVSRPATHFAVVDETTGALVYAGSAGSYVRTVTSWNGTIYVGGDFTTFGGASRARLAALSPSFAVTSWNPGSSSRVRALLAGPLGVYVGGDAASVRMLGRTGSTIWSQPVTDGAVRSFALSPDAATLYVGGLFETYGGLVRHGLVKASPSSGAPSATFDARLRVDSTTGTYAGFDGEAPVSMEVTRDGRRVVCGIAGHGADEIRVVDSATGALVWIRSTPGDGQAVAVVGSTYVVGYHRNRVNGTVPYPNFAAQLESRDGQLTDWDPGLEGDQSNADGGNNGVQAVATDPAAGRLFVAGAFTSAFGQPLFSLAVFPYAAQPARAPTASFSSALNGSTAAFDAAPSFDPDGTALTYAWSFGDGSVASGIAPAHAYDAAGTYPVTLTVTDASGATGTATSSVVVGASVFAADSFARTVSGGLGVADVGGAWSTTGAAAAYSVSAGVGRLSVGAGTSLTAHLPAVAVSDADVRASLALDRAPTGSGLYAAVLGRRASSSADYRLKLRAQPDGTLTAQLVRTDAGTEIVLATAAPVPGTTWTATGPVTVRLQVTGTSPTRLAAKVWRQGSTEPSAWLLQTTDATAALQTPGSVGVSAYLSSSATAPVVLSVSDLTGGPAG